MRGPSREDDLDYLDDLDDLDHLGLMNRFFSALGAGWGAKKLGGGCFSTILIFILLYFLLRNL